MIPIKLRKELEQDPFYKTCCLTGRTDGKIEKHHNLIFAGKQVQKKFAILPVHNDLHQYHRKITSRVKELLNRIMVARMTEEELDYYSKAVDLRKYK